MLLQQILSGLANGLIYALIGLGFAVIYRSMRLINFAQGELFMVGAFVALLITNYTGFSFILVLPLTFIICMFGGIAMQWAVLAPRSDKATELNLIIRTIGLSVVLQGTVLIIWGTGEYRFPPIFPTGSIMVGDLSVPLNILFIGGAVCILLLLLTLFLKYSYLGLCMRALAQDPLGAEIIGVNTKLIRSIAFGLSAALAGTAGLLIAPLWYLDYRMGVMMGLKGFTAAVIGSLGNLSGAVLGGLFLGVLENLSAGYVSSALKDAVTFALLIAVLALRPQGILGLRVKARV